MVGWLAVAAVAGLVGWWAWEKAHRKTHPVPRLTLPIFAAMIERVPYRNIIEGLLFPLRQAPAGALPGAEGASWKRLKERPSYAEAILGTGRTGRSYGLFRDPRHLLPSR
jgi:hypothetical protein